MTEIMPAPRNSHITVLRPPSIGAAVFCEDVYKRQVLEDGQVICPNCGEKLEFDLSSIDEEDEAPQDEK